MYEVLFFNIFITAELFESDHLPYGRESYPYQTCDGIFFSN